MLPADIKKHNVLTTTASHREKEKKLFACYGWLNTHKTGSSYQVLWLFSSVLETELCNFLSLPGSFLTTSWDMIKWKQVCSHLNQFILKQKQKPLFKQKNFLGNKIWNLLQYSKPHLCWVFAKNNFHKEIFLMGDVKSLGPTFQNFGNRHFHILGVSCTTCQISVFTDLWKVF